MKRKFLTLLGLFGMAILVSVTLTSCDDDDDSSPDDNNGDPSDEIWEPYKFKANTYFAYSFNMEQEGESQMQGTAEITIDDPAVTIVYEVNGEEEVESSANDSDDIADNYQNAVSQTPLAGILYQAQWISVFSNNNLETGNTWSLDDDEGTLYFEVTGTETYSGIEGKVIEMDLIEDDETTLSWIAVINTEIPLPLMSQIEDFEEDIFYDLELTDYQD